MMRVRLSHLPGLTVLLGAMLAVTFFAACGDGTTAPPPDPPRATTITVSPATADLAALGATVQLSAEVRDQNGQVMAGAAVTWASSTADVATVDSTGLATAVVNGSTTITVTSGSASGSATVTVAQEVSAVVVLSAQESLGALGDTLRLSAEALDANGHVVADAEFSWESSDEAVATVDSTGLATAVVNGSTTITATSGWAGGSSTVTVAQEIRTVAVLSAKASLAAPGDTQRLAAEALDANGHAVADAEFSWESSDEAVATVDSTGLVTAGGDGTATVTATVGGMTGTATVRVAMGGATGNAATDRAALVALYNATDGPNWANNENWLTDATLDEWHGVATDSVGRVVTVSLRQNELTGEIPVELGGLASLRELSLYDNQLTGEIPAELGGLASLWSLDLHENRLTGEIPAELGSLPYLDLRQNRLTGEIPAELGSLGSLEYLFLSHNRLTGEIPAELGGLASLGSLWLHGNQLTGEIPAELGELASLKALWLADNQLTGEIPAELGRLTSLEQLWLRDNQLTGEIPAELGELASLLYLALHENQLTGEIPVELGELASLSYLFLNDNQLTGEIPAELGELASLRDLLLNENQLTGEIPLALASLSALERFWYHGTGLCVPADASFRAWLIAIPDHSGTGVDCATRSDRDIIEVLYHATGGPGWSNSTGWLTDAALNEWHGVTTDSVGRVVDLDLRENELEGEIPAELGSLDSLRSLYLHDNSELAGMLPLSLASLSALATFRYDGTGLCVPGDASFHAWLRSLQTHRGTGLTCGDPVLVALYNATDGPNWVNNDNWLTDAPLDEWYGVFTNSAGQVEWLILDANGLAGEIPPELGDLATLEWLILSANELSGPIPPELGKLVNLQELILSANELSGPIPPELGKLANLELLHLGLNDLSGAIPPWLGNLANLKSLDLGWNNLSGAIPSELGKLANLELLDLGLNDLSGAAIPSWLEDLANLRSLNLLRSGLWGAIPPWLGNLANLELLDLGLNDLSGAIPPELGNLANLKSLDLGSNALSGAIPPRLGDLANLDHLTLSRNALSGAIPPRLGDLANLQSLLLNRNDLSGPIPRELGNLANLEGLWLQENDLSGGIPPKLGNLGNLEQLRVDNNALSGAIPPELGNLGNLEQLRVDNNALSGAIPPELVVLPLRSFQWHWNSGLCAPGTSVFVEWLDGVETERSPYCNASDHAVLTNLYELASGSEWSESSGWLDGPALGKWHGVEADTLGRVTALDLGDNGLSGGLPGVLGSLGQLTRLRLDRNALGGRLPLALRRLDLEEFHYYGTDLCEPADAKFRTWLRGIPARRGTGDQCAPLTDDRDVLVALYEGTGGSGWWNSDGWLSDRPLGEWHGVDLNARGRVTRLSLADNRLTGAIPPELGNLANLESLSLYGNDLSGTIPPELRKLANLQWLDLDGNALSGAIPPELDNLAGLETLWLSGNDLSGEIPPELGNLANLWSLDLDYNNLTGEIPPELGDLANLQSLYLSANGLSGEIPPELGNLASLETLALGSNILSGAIPPTFGGLARLTELNLSHNAGLAGAMPAGLRDLTLESLVASGTELCVPREPAFEEWLLTIPRRRIAVCGQPPAAYLVQTVQSRAHPVPLVAGEEALLRVFVTAAMETTEGIPEVQARFYLNGNERHVAGMAASSTPIPTEIDEGDLAKSANAEIPGWLVQPGLEMVVEIDPGGELDASLGVPARIPAEGRLAVEVREMPVLDLTVIPFLWNSDPDSAIIGLVEGMAADPEGHALLDDTHVLLPVGDIDVTARPPVASTSNNAFDLLFQTEAIRVLEGGAGHYKGMMSGAVTAAGGVAFLGGRSSFSQPYSGIVAHELGHNMSLGHAWCGGAFGPDPSFPDPRGSIGAWGYDFRSDRLVPPTRKDHMSYCDPGWTSDYHFTNALGHRLLDEGASAAVLAAGPVRSLLLWGGVDTTDTPFLNPAFVADAPPALPDSAGDYSVTGRDASGRELFSLSFAMPVALSEDGGVSSFVFAMPTRSGWADALVSVTLSGPAGTATLDGSSDTPMAILRDPATGRVRGFLRGVDDPAAIQAAADAPAGGQAGMNVLFSRGIPNGTAWRK